MAAATAVTAAHQQGARIIFIDETTFTSQTILEKAWAHKDAPMAVTDRQLKSGRLNLIMAVSEDRGIDDWYTTFENLGSGFTITLLESIAANNSGWVVVFLDNAAFHRSKRVGERAAELGIQLVFNAAYSPAYNPIELEFGPLKHYYKCERLRSMYDQKNNLQNQLVYAAIEKLNKQGIMNTCTRGLQKLKGLIAT